MNELERIREHLSRLKEEEARELLGERGYMVLAMYSGVLNAHPHTPTEIAALFGVPREEVEAWLEEAKARLADYSG
ncbi:hypothetical protein [Thermus caliditerrae]|uniref:hypothetical protein n=1 Tax=Thermus caliditerrae TaxID=1330700 RepID=UPI001F1AB3FE|nr:hypothetical protein [Thermus caliditerrae]